MKNDTLEKLKEKTLNDIYMAISENTFDPGYIQFIESKIEDDDYNYSDYLYYMAFLLNNTDRKINIVTQIDNKIFDLINKDFINLEERNIIYCEKITSYIPKDKIKLYLDNNQMNLEIDNEELLSKSLEFQNNFNQKKEMELIKQV